MHGYYLTWSFAHVFPTSGASALENLNIKMFIYLVYVLSPLNANAIQKGISVLGITRASVIFFN